MKIIFLDCDGVLNSHQSTIYYGRFTDDVYKDFCPIAFSNFQYILENMPDLKIVISSAWRTNRMKYIKANFEKAGIDFEGRVIGSTPKFWGQDRGIEIQCWMDECTEEIEAFVILDDGRDMAHLMDRLVLTNGHHGLDLEKALEVLNKLGVKHDFSH